jgi:signal peptidase I
VIDEQTKRPNTFWRELPVLLGVAIVVAIVVRAFVLQTFYIPSESMENTLLIRDRVLVNKLVYDFRSPHRGEVIVFKAPEDWRSDPAEEDFIKRIIGVGGDHIVCCDVQHRLVVNDHSLDEPYIYADPDGVADLASDEPFDITVPKGRLWVMGDNRGNSEDSRFHQDLPGRGTVPDNDVVGKVWAIVWPFGRAHLLHEPKTFENPQLQAGTR